MRRIHQIPFQAILQRRVCDFTAREAQGHKYRSLWADLSDESAPIGAYDPRSIWNHFIPHPNVAVLVCDRCRIIAPTSHAKTSKLNVSGEAIFRKRSWPREDNSAALNAGDEARAGRDQEQDRRAGVARDDGEPQQRPVGTRKKL